MLLGSYCMYCIRFSRPREALKLSERGVLHSIRYIIECGFHVDRGGKKGVKRGPKVTRDFRLAIVVE